MSHPVRRLRRAPAALIALVLSTALLAAACGGGGDDSSTKSSDTTQNGDVPAGSIAVVSGKNVPRTDLDNLMLTAKQNYVSAKRTFPKKGTNEYEQLKQQAVAQLIQQVQLEVGADREGVTVSSSDVDKQLLKLQKQYFPSKKAGAAFDQAAYTAAIKKQNLTEAQLKERIAASLREQKVYDKVTKPVVVTDKDIQKYYTDNKKTLYTQPSSRHVRHILVKDKKQADKLYGELKGHDQQFAALAKKFSKDPGSAAKGGDLGNVTKGQTVAPFDKVAFGIVSGIVSKPVKTEFGYHIIEALGAVKAATVKPLNTTLKTSIKTQLSQTKKQRAFFDWYQKLKKDLDAKTVYAAGYQPPKTATTTTGATTTG